MNSGTWIAIYLPLFIIFFIVLPQQNTIRKAIVVKIKKRRGNKMTSEVILKYVGKNCHISTGTFGINIDGKIISVNENWIEVETKKGNELINAEFVQSIRINSKEN